MFARIQAQLVRHAQRTEPGIGPLRPGYRQLAVITAMCDQRMQMRQVFARGNVRFQLRQDAPGQHRKTAHALRRAQAHAGAEDAALAEAGNHAALRRNAMRGLQLLDEVHQRHATGFGLGRVNLRTIGGEDHAEPRMLAEAKFQRAARQHHQRAGRCGGGQHGQVGFVATQAMQQHQQGGGLGWCWLAYAIGQREGGVPDKRGQRVHATSFRALLAASGKPQAKESIDSTPSVMPPRIRCAASP